MFDFLKGERLGFTIKMFHQSTYLISVHDFDQLVLQILVEQSACRLAGRFDQACLRFILRCHDETERYADVNL